MSQFHFHPDDRELLFSRKLPMLVVLLVWPISALAQQQKPPIDLHEHVAVTAPALIPTKEAPGTAWLPQTTPMYGVHRSWRNWDYRVAGVVFGQALYEPRDRHRTGGASRSQVGSINWAMFMARRDVGGGRLGIRTMFSAEPWTISSCGSLSFLATGEVCQGDTIHDRQQQHALFMELAVDYDHRLRGNWRWQAYAGPAGEPAFGTPGYLHRPSAMAIPLGPVTHHWLESTPVTSGVVTLGVHNQRWKAEASTFNGREPDESRVDLDLGAFDSLAGRVSFLPTERIALQVSAARLRDVRTDFPFPKQDPAVRVAASAVYHKPLGENGIWATTVAVGAKHARETVAGGLLDATTAAGLVETTMTLANRHSLFGRAEVGQMPAHHLHAPEFVTSVFAIGKAQLGYVRHLSVVKGLQPSIGGAVSLSFLPPALAPRYDGRTAPSIAFFFSLRGARHPM